MNRKNNRTIYKVEKDRSGLRKAVIAAIAGFVFVISLIFVGPQIGKFSLVTSSLAAETNETESESETESQAVSALRSGITSHGGSLIRSGLTSWYEPVNEEYKNVLIANVESYLNVRAEASEDASVVGYMFFGDSGTITESSGGWYHITSGNVDGWVTNEFVVTGNDAAEFAEENCDMRAVVQGDGVWVRSEADTNSSELVTVSTNESYIITDKLDGWYQIEYSEDGDLGYISADFVQTSIDLGTAVTVDEYNEMIAAEQAAAEAAAEAEAAAAAAQTSQSAPAAVQTEAVAASYDDAYLLACICRVESGSYEGMVAVANVIINRVNSGGYPNSISGVIYQSGQFATGSRFQSYLANGPGSTAIAAANDALAGTNLIGGLLHFGAAGHVEGSVVVGGNAFY